MKEVKFRAWSEQEKRIIPWEELRFLNAGTLFEHVKNVTQFTGIVARDGREIYKGDILRLHCGSQDGTFEKAEISAEVIWNIDRFTVDIPDRKVIPKQGSMKGKKVDARTMHSWVGMHTCLLEWSEKLEIIGNIYENPKLLKS